MPVLLVVEDASAALADLLGDEGTPEEQAYVEQLRSEGLMHEWESADDDADDLRPLLERRDGPASAVDLAVLESIDIDDLEEPHERLAFLLRCDRLTARVLSLRMRMVGSIAGHEPAGSYVDEVHLEHELAVAGRTSRYAVGKGIETSRALATTFPAFATALHDGEISLGHCSVLVERTRLVTDAQALAAIEQVGVRRARRMTVGEFAREVTALVVRFDPDSAARVTRAREDRRVSARPLDDGLGFLGLVHDWTVIQQIHDQVTLDAKVMQAQRRAEAAADSVRDESAISGAMPDESAGLEAHAARSAAEAVARSAADDARLDVCRADALAARLLAPTARGASQEAAAQPGAASESVGVPDVDSRILGQPRADAATQNEDPVAPGAERAPALTQDRGPVVWERHPGGVEVQLVIDLDTLRGEADNPCLLDGEPLPAALGRDLAGYARVFRRMVTDPVDGHLLDYGTRTYLPRPLRDYISARDGGCRSPGCTTRAASRLQLDHVTVFPQGGSDAANTGMLCTTCHQVKTAGLVEIRDSAADGSATWATSWGQSVWIPPRSFLPTVEPPPPPQDRPPF
jgi:hypothetical protein